ncbi:hypothetical protein V8E55_008895 [Tylopilus felleus]
MKVEGVRMTKECKITITPIEKEERMVSIPARVYYHTCIGILFTPCSIPITKKEARLEDAVARSETADHAVVMKRRKDNPHSNVIVPLETFNAVRKGQMCTNLGAIRGFLNDQLSLMEVENRVLDVSISELKRPVQYFRSLH